MLWVLALKVDAVIRGICLGRAGKQRKAKGQSRGLGMDLCPVLNYILSSSQHLFTSVSTLHKSVRPPKVGIRSCLFFSVLKAHT